MVFGSSGENRVTSPIGRSRLGQPSTASSDATTSILARIGANSIGCAFYGSDKIDASLLNLPLVGFLPVTDARIQKTITTIERELVREGYVHRWGPTEEVYEAAFLACNGWLADCQLLQGRRSEAENTFQRLLDAANDLGLLSEEYDVRAGRLAGNFPQALSHLALVRTALRFGWKASDRGEEHETSIQRRGRTSGSGQGTVAR